MMAYRMKMAVLLVAAAVFAGFVYAQAPFWENLYPQFRGLAFGAGKFVAVSEDGLIKASSAGTGWSQVFLRENGNDRRFSTVAFGADKFIAMQGGSQHHIAHFLYSANGTSWGEGNISTRFPCTYITYGSGAFLAVDNEGVAIRYDDDGWDIVPSPAEELSHATYGAGKYVAVGSSIVTGDGRGWSSSYPASGGAGAVAYGNDIFVAVGSSGTSVYTSQNGTSWTSTAVSGGTLPTRAADMVFGGGKFVVVGASGKGAVSSNGTSWTGFTLNSDDNFKAVKYGNNTFVALGANGSVYTSTDGASWKKDVDGGRIMSYKQVIYGGNKFVAVGDSGVSVSSDGKAWARKSAGKQLRAVAYGAGRYVATGDSGVLYSSADGEAWSANTDFSDVMFTSIAFGGKFVLGGYRGTGQSFQTVVLTSVNGQAWDDEYIELQAWSKQSQYPTSICYGAGKFIATNSNVGGSVSSGVLWSADSSAYSGRFWSRITSLPADADAFGIISVTYANGRFVALGTSTGTNAQKTSLILTSQNGSDWTAMAGPDRANSAIYAKDFYIVAADSGNIYASNGGGSGWVSQPKATNRNLLAIGSGSNALIAAGAGGALLYSEMVPTSIGYKTAPRKLSQSNAGAIRIDRTRHAPVVTLSFTPSKPGTIAIYSLTGKLIYKQRLASGERSVQLPDQLRMPSGSVIVRYSGEGKAVSRRFQFAR